MTYPDIEQQRQRVMINKGPTPKPEPDNLHTRKAIDDKGRRRMAYGVKAAESLDPSELNDGDLLLPDKYGNPLKVWQNGQWTVHEVTLSRLRRAGFDADVEFSMESKPVKSETEEEDTEAAQEYLGYPREEQARIVVDLLSMVEDEFPALMPTEQYVAEYWSWYDRLGVVCWAQAVHLRASDNDDVVIPELPVVLRAPQPPKNEVDSFPEWLFNRFSRSGRYWSNLTSDDQDYWAHEADAVRRAVARNGFRDYQPTWPKPKGTER